MTKQTLTAFIQSLDPTMTSAQMSEAARLATPSNTKSEAPTDTTLAFRKLVAIRRRFDSEYLCTCPAHTQPHDHEWTGTPMENRGYYNFVAVDSEGRSDTRPKDEPLSKYVCGKCIHAHKPPIDVSDDRTEVWCLDDDGWLGPIECMDCGESIPVELDDETTEVIPDMDERVRALHEANNG